MVADTLSDSGVIHWACTLAIHRAIVHGLLALAHLIAAASGNVGSYLAEATKLGIETCTVGARQRINAGVVVAATAEACLGAVLETCAVFRAVDTVLPVSCLTELISTFLTTQGRTIWTSAGVSSYKYPTNEREPHEKQSSPKSQTPLLLQLRMVTLSWRIISLSSWEAMWQW